MPDSPQDYPPLRWNLSATEIEEESFRTIESECPEAASMPQPQWRVARRLIHTTADMEIIRTLAFRHAPIECALETLKRRAPIFCDTNMIRAGISVDRLRRLNPAYEREDIHCYISDPDVVAQARAANQPRALSATQKALPLLDGGIVLVGNAPLCLARIARYILEEKVRPALVIGMPVGFVNVVESKQLLGMCEVPQIVLEGRRGGSALAVATLHAIIESA